MKIVRKVMLPKLNDRGDKFVVFTDDNHVYVENEPESQVIVDGFGEVAAFKNCLVLNGFAYNLMTDQMILDKVKPLMEE